MRGYGEASYGDGFADVYDDWYRGISDVDATVATLAGLAAGGPVLELGVGTGRLAIPLAATGLDVTGVDASEAMLACFFAKEGAERVTIVRGDMVRDLPAGPFALVFVAYNTLFNLVTRERQEECFAAVAARLVPDGVFVVEAFVPTPQPGPEVSVRSLEADRVVLSVSVRDDANQRAEGHFVELTESGGVRLRPWSIRYADTAELDAMAAAAGLELRERWESFDRAAFTSESERHVSVYRHTNSSQAVVKVA